MRGSPDGGAPGSVAPGGAAPRWAADLGTSLGGYRAHLDGMRAVAVYLVVAFHSGADRVAGGFIGVDVFFVLSGYLVTAVLVGDLAAGGLRFGRFYSRRMRRLLPAAAANLVATALVFRAMGAPAEMEAARGAMRAAAVYVSNWWFIRESTDYFGADVDQSPVAHYWSLSVEEQFYLLWPLALWSVHRLAGRSRFDSRRVTATVVAIVAVVSLGRALTLGEAGVSRAYYGTDTRAYQLLAGAMLVLLPGLISAVRRRSATSRASIWLGPLLLGLLGLVASDRMAMGPIQRGVLATAITVSLLICLEAGTGGPLRRMLSWNPIVYLGRISYGTYLWHWIVILVATRQLGMAPLATFAVAVPVATGLAALSYELLEQPIRSSRRMDPARRTVVVVGLAVSVLLAAVVMPRLTEVQARSGGPVAATSAVGTPNHVDWAAQRQRDSWFYDRCPPGAEEPCRLTEGGEFRILVVGDSHAGMLTPLLAELAERRGAELWANYLSYCPWVRGLAYLNAGVTCLEEQEHLYREIIAAVEPDLVVMAHRAVDDPLQGVMLRADGRRPVDPTTGPGRRALEKAIRDSVEAVRSTGGEVLMVEPVPIAAKDADPFLCLSRSSVLEECRWVASSGPLGEEKIMREVAREDSGVWTLDLDRLVCRWHPICDAAAGDEVVMIDNNHVASEFALAWADDLELHLEAEGVFDR